MLVFQNLRKFIFKSLAVKRAVNSTSLITVIALLFFLQATTGCKKEKTKLTPVPFLTGRTWVADTLLITPPKTYAQLSAADQQNYNQAKAWFHNATIRFNEDGTATPGGDYDLGYKTWKLINNNKDIQVLTATGSVLVLRDWTADNTQLTYVLQLNNSYDATLVFK